MFVYKRMTHNPVTINREASILDAMEVMRVSKVRRLPVVDKDDKVVGIVTDKNLHVAAPSLATTLSKHEANYLLTKIKISEIMTKNVITVTSGSTIEEVALLMYKNKIGGIPVVDNETSKIAGIITETDIFKILVDVMGLPEGKTRITVTFKDRVGLLADIGLIFKELNENITSFAIVDTDGGNKEMVIRGDFKHLEEIKDKMEKSGFSVIDITRIS